MVSECPSIDFDWMMKIFKWFKPLVAQNTHKLVVNDTYSMQWEIWPDQVNIYPHLTCEVNEQ